MATAQTNRTETRRQKELAWRQERMQKREKDKALEEEQDSVAYQEAVQALKDGEWVLEASDVIFFNGILRFVTASTNFVSMHNGTATVQTAFDNFNYSGPNGLGGITLRGNAWGSSLSTDKDGNYYYSFSVQGIGMSAMVYLVLTGGTCQASASINPNFTGRRLTMNGFLYPYSKADIFEGMSW